MRVITPDSLLVKNAFRLEGLRKTYSEVEADLSELEAQHSQLQETYEQVIEDSQGIRRWRRRGPRIGMVGAVVGITGFTVGINLVTRYPLVGSAALGLGLLGIGGIVGGMYLIENRGLLQQELDGRNRESELKFQVEFSAHKKNEVAAKASELRSQIWELEQKESARDHYTQERKAFELGFREELVEVGDFRLERQD